MAATPLVLLAFAVATPTIPVDASSRPPPGMIAVPGETTTIGAGDAARQVRIAAFFVDEHVVTIGAYRACRQAGACPPLPVGKGGDDEPMLADHASAERFCAFAGKRLPAESEWELAARKASSAPSWSTTRHLEWTNTWFVLPSSCKAPMAPLLKESAGTWAAAQCGSIDVLDPCDGAPFCGSLAKRVLKDPGTPSTRTPGLARDAFDGIESGGLGPRAAIRCASSTKRLTRFPPRALTSPLPEPPLPSPPTPEMLQRFGAIAQDTLDVPTCDKPGRSFVDCRDPRSYLKTNEPKIGVVLPYVKNRGGGYTGVASDQNYTFVARARSQWVWLFDYDENVVRWHHVLEALIKAAPDREAFIAFFAPDGEKAGIVALEQHAAGDPEKKTLIELYFKSRNRLRSYYLNQATNKEKSYTWLGNDASYSWVRMLYQQGRMRAFKGNMLDKNTMRSIGDAARALSVPIRVYYPSNAPEFWAFTDQYRQNVIGLPFDDESIVVQTISGLSLKTGFGQRGYWHYNVQHGLAHQAKLALPGFTRHKQVLHHRTKADDPDLTLSDTPSDDPGAPVPR